MDEFSAKFEFSASNNLLKVLLEETPDAVFIRDKNGVFIMVNEAYASLLGVDIAEIVGKTSQQIFHPDIVKYIHEQDRKIMDAGETLTYDEEIVIRGEMKKLRTTAGIFQDEHDLRGGTFGIVHDVTDQMHAEDKIRKYAEQSEALSKLSNTIFEVGLEYPAILETVAKSISELFGGACLIHLLSEKGQQFDLAALHHPDPEFSNELHNMLILSQPVEDAEVVGWNLPEDEPLYYPLLANDQIRTLVKQEYWTKFEEFEFSLIVIPLRTQRGLIGAMSVALPRLTSPHLLNGKLFLKELSHRTAFAIENARLHTAETWRLRELNALYTATTALLITLDLDSLLGQILDAAMSAIPSADKGLLNLIAPDTGKLEIRAMFGYKDPRIKTYTRTKIQGYTARAVREKRPLIINDAHLETGPDGLDEFPELRSIKSIIVAPLILNDQVLGALVLNASKRAAFTENDLKLLVSFAATTSAAIKNALLHREVQQLAITDSLTNLYNRRGFFELGRREIERARRFGHPLSAVMLDIDHFKLINDTHGHAIGDQVLEELAHRLSRNVREFDILGRYGGEEFSLLLPETDLFTACTVSDRLRLVVSDSPMSTEIGPLSITVSLGVVKATPDIPNLDVLLKRADKALYAAKQNGRNRVEVL